MNSIKNLSETVKQSRVSEIKCRDFMEEFCDELVCDNANVKFQIKKESDFIAEMNYYDAEYEVEYTIYLSKWNRDWMIESRHIPLQISMMVIPLPKVANEIMRFVNIFIGSTEEFIDEMNNIDITKKVNI